MFQEVEIYEKKGVQIATPFNVTVLDANGKLFLKPQTRIFNLPPGKFYINCEYRFCKSKKFRPINLPPKERSGKVKPFIQKFVNNPNKCSIDRKTGTIFWDRNFYNSLPLFKRVFVLLHEEGHFFYETEKYCDLYATKKMLNLGFNPSQIATAQISTLKNLDSKERIHHVFNHIKL